MRCIFCLVDKEPSVEHVFPESLGGTFKIQTVCRDCNSRLGTKVDCHLSENWLVQGQRLVLGIKGKSGKVPNPLKSGTLVDNPNQKLLYILDANGRPERLHAVQSVTREPVDGGGEKISIRIDKSEEDRLPGIVNRIRTRAGLPEVSEAEIDALKGSGSSPPPWMQLNVEVDLVQYQRAVLKIAYELCATWLGERFVDDPHAAHFREVIFSEGLSMEWQAGHPLGARINFTGGNPTLPNWNSEPHSHVGVVVPTATHLLCYVRVFGIIDALVKVTAEPTRYDDFEGRVLVLDPKTGQYRETSYAEECTRAFSTGSWSSWLT